MAKKSISDKLINYFIGTSVGVVLKDVKTNDNDNLPIDNVTIEGVLIDSDDTCLYLGNEDMQVNTAINRSDIVMVMSSSIINGENTDDINVPPGSIQQ